ncbi:MAG: hypothetical protein HQK89_15155, partial [Nitrospirae bacterium]|nr:hypothetical protein [Nitrospirota bacterium]
ETMEFDTINGKTKIVYKAVNDITIPVVGRLMALIQIRMINMFIDKCLKNLKVKMEA